MTRIKNSVKSIIGTGVIAVIAGLLMTASPAQASVSGYMKLDDIKGECIESAGDAGKLLQQYNELVPQINEDLAAAIDLAEEIAEQEAEAQAHKPGGGATGQSRRRGDVVLEDIVVVKEMDKSTPKLIEKISALESDLDEAQALLKQAKEIVQRAAEAADSGEKRYDDGDDGQATPIDVLMVINQAQAAIEEAVTIVGEIGTE